MAQALEQLIEQSTRHQVYLERLKSGEVNQFASFLQQIDRSIRLRLSGEEITAYSRTRLERLLATVRADLSAIYAEYWDELSGNLIDLSEYEAGFEARSLNAVAQGAFETVIPAANQVWAAVTAAPLSVSGPDQGKLLEPFVKDWSATEVKRVSGAIRQGYFEGQTTSQILQRVRGTRANGYRDGILAISNRNAEAVVRTAVQHVASISRQETWSQNPDIVEGVEWVSTLDSRTTQVCRSLDGQVYPIGKGPRPPIHIRCRSTTAAVLNQKFSFLSEGGTRSARGKGGVARVDADTTYYGWLKRQPAAFQDSVVGPVRGKLLREGGLSAERFAEIGLNKNFTPTTLAEMRELEPVAFERAGL
ncbi:minor capsid protein [Pseudohongiella sp. O18]|uniref:minor capsid protein n=1 Tax=Pseudohongiella sp. O18 TaxID=2904248 RepID=UPI001F00F0CC|nr:minor capsid protein [Pseudohongiella sp. O18]